MLTMNMTYRIYPDASQEQQFLEWLETCRRLYNRCLRDLKTWINSRKCPIDRCSLEQEYIVPADRPFPSYLEQKKHLTQWKKSDKYLQSTYSQVTQDVVKRLHNTWEAFKQRGYGFPRFKKFGQYRSFLFPQFKQNPSHGNTIKLPKIGNVVINQHRPIPDGFVVKGVRVLSRARNTKWYVVVTIQADVSVPNPPAQGRAIGLDIGLENFLTTSDQYTVEPSHFFKDLQSQLKSLQRKVAKKKKGSKNWHKAQTKVARLHHKIDNTRKDFHFQTAHDLCDQADLIFVEDIDFRVSAKGFLGKQMLDGGFGQFREILKWVCWKRGKYFGRVDHKYTSQICPNCGTHTGKKELSERNHSCAECGYTTTRDHASAQVIQQRGIASVPSDRGERKLSANKSASPGETPGAYDGRGVLSGISYLDKCRCRNTQSQG